MGSAAGYAGSMEPTRPAPPHVAGLAFPNAWHEIAGWFAQPRAVRAGYRGTGVIELELQDWALGDAHDAAAHEPKVWTLAFLRTGTREQSIVSDAGPGEAERLERAEWGIELDFADHQEWARVTNGPDWSWDSSVGWFMVGPDGDRASELIRSFERSDVAAAARSSELLDTRLYDSSTRSFP